MSDQTQYLRKASLLVVRPGQPAPPTIGPAAKTPDPTALDLSELHFTFNTEQQDVESPNNCSIRVFNLSAQTVQSVTKNEYTQVVLQAGYESAGYGIIFSGQIKQFRIGRLNATDTYFDILAADGDEAYNYARVGTTLAAGSTPEQRIGQIVGSMNDKGVSLGANSLQYTGGVLPRGKVLFGLARDSLRREVEYQSATWNIDNGKVVILPLDGYKDGQVVVLNALTGLVGIPEQTNQGVQIKCLLNPRITVGGLVQIDNKTVNRLVQQNPNAAPVAFNSYTGIQQLADEAADGIYRVYVVEHEGDTRGTPWYSNLTCLAVDPVTKKVQPFGG